MSQQFHFWVYTQMNKKRGFEDIFYTQYYSQIVKTWKQSQYASMDGWMSKMQYIHTVVQQSTLKTKEILSYTAKCMNPEDVNAK